MPKAVSIKIPNYVWFDAPGTRRICATEADKGKLIDWLRGVADTLEDGDYEEV